MIERAIAILLLNALWEPLAIAACAFLVLRLSRQASAATRCAVLTTAIVGALVLPIVTTAFVYRAAPATLTASPTTLHTAHTQTPVRVTHLPKAVNTGAAQTSGSTASAPATPSMQRPVLSVPPQIVRAAVLVWALIAVLLVVRLLVSLAHLGQLRRNALPISPQVREQLRRWNEKAAGIEVRLCLSDETVVPIAVGLFDCMVLIPRRLIEELEPADLDRIVLHEIAHLRRRDGVIYALQQIANALYFFSPGVAWLSRTLDIEREVACDDWVLERRSDATPYANCLVRLAEGVPWPHKALAAPGAFVTRHSMSIRIERILQHARDARLRAAPAPVAAAIAAAGVIAAIGLSFAPSLAYPVVQAVHQVSAVRAAHPAKAKARVVQAKAAAKQFVVREAVAATPAPALAKTHVHVRAANVTAVKLQAAKTAAPIAAAPKAAVNHVAVEVAPASPKLVASEDYIAEMRAIFGTQLSVDDLVALKSVGVTPDYVRQVRAVFPNATVHDIIGARADGLTGQRIASYRAAFGNVSLNDMIALASMDVDAAYRQQLEAAGLKNLTARRLIELKSVGVTPDYIRQANAFGFGTLSANQLVELRSMGIDRAYLERVRQHGFQNITFQQLIELKASGVIE
jgi:beta-lactamase regulating signal transducer with metallopeptidase domain